MTKYTKDWITDIANGIADDCMGGAVGASTGEQVASQLPGRTDGPADAYRHLLWSAELTRKYGKEIAEPLLKGHEEGQTDSGTAMDSYNNDIGVSIGKYIRANKGSWQDVKQLTREVVYWSLAPYNPDDITPSNWYSLPNGNLISYKNNIVTLNNGLSIPSISLVQVSGWSKNPKNSNGNELTNEESNWPTSTGWKSEFIYEEGNKARSYSGDIEPFSLPCKAISRIGGASFGDPHLLTTDTSLGKTFNDTPPSVLLKSGLSYDFQQPGEFVLIEETNQVGTSNSNTTTTTNTKPPFTLQVRQELLPTSNSVSINTAVATNLGNNTNLQISLPPKDTHCSSMGNDDIFAPNTNTTLLYGGEDNGSVSFSVDGNTVLVGSSAYYSPSVGYYLTNGTAPVSGQMLWTDVHNTTIGSAVNLTLNVPPSQLGFFMLPGGTINNGNPLFVNGAAVTFQLLPMWTGQQTEYFWAPSINGTALDNYCQGWGSGGSSPVFAVYTDPGFNRQFFGSTSVSNGNYALGVCSSSVTIGSNVTEKVVFANYGDTLTGGTGRDTFGYRMGMDIQPFFLGHTNAMARIQ